MIFIINNGYKTLLSKPSFGRNDSSISFARRWL